MIRPYRLIHCAHQRFQLWLALQHPSWPLGRSWGIESTLREKERGSRGKENHEAPRDGGGEGEGKAEERSSRGTASG